MPNLPLVDRIVEMEKILEASNKALTEATQRIKDLVARIEELEAQINLNVDYSKQVAKLEGEVSELEKSRDYHVKKNAEQVEQIAKIFGDNLRLRESK